jgi:hypothetical protein
MKDENYKLTTVKVLSENYSQFKVETLTTPMTLQKLVNRAISEYLNNKDFKKELDAVELLKDNKKY